MKNLIKLLALATVSLTACQKTQYANDPNNHDNPKIGISGFIVDSLGHAVGNSNFYTSTVDQSIILKSALAYVVGVHFRTNASGYFNTTIRVAEAGDSIYIYNDSAIVTRMGSFKVEPPIEKWRDVGTVPFTNIRFHY